MQQTLEQLTGASDGSETMEQIQRILSPCHVNLTTADSTPQQAWAWVRLVIDKICVLATYVKALHHCDVPSEDDAELMFAFLNAAAELIVPAVASDDASRALVMNEDDLKALVSALDHIKVVFSHRRVPPAVFQSTKLQLAHLRATIPHFNEDWNAKDVSVMNRRRKFAEMLLTREDWAAGGRCRGSAMDHMMDQFEKNVQSSVTLGFIRRRDRAGLYHRYGKHFAHIGRPNHAIRRAAITIGRMEERVWGT